MEKAIDQMAKEVLDSCKNLKKICSGFNLVDELYIVLQQLEMEARSLQSTEARQSAENFIRSIRQLCDSMSNQQQASAGGRRNDDIDIPRQDKKAVGAAPKEQEKKKGTFSRVFSSFMGAS